MAIPFTAPDRFRQRRRIPAAPSRRQAADPGAGKKPAERASGGFTLIELVVVVLIIGLIYGIVINNINRSPDSTAKEVRLDTLRDYMQQLHQKNRLSLICTDRCRTCTLFADGENVGEIPPFVDSSAEYYRFDYYKGAETFEWTPFYDEEGREKEVCFRYDLYPDGSSSEMMVAYKGRVVDFPGFFGETTTYTSLEEAVGAKQERYEEIRQ